MSAQPMPWRPAWDAALYGPHGFFRSSRPRDHFRTSAHTAVFAEAVAELARRSRAATVVDVGAGGGELLTALRHLLPGVRLIGVEKSERPDGLAADIEWTAEPAPRVEGLLIANEWLDNVPAEIVEVVDGTVRELLVDPATGIETAGEPAGAEAREWLDRWWPLTDEGHRAEIGATRDAAWAEVVARVDGIAVAIDYGHLRENRPPFGSLTSFLAGREVDVVPDGSRDVTAHVAVDSVVAAAGGQLLRQRDALGLLGVTGDRPPIALAHSDPAAYLQALGRAGEAGELLARGGLGDFWWIVADTAGHGTLAP